MLQESVLVKLTFILGPDFSPKVLLDGLTVKIWLGSEENADLCGSYFGLSDLIREATDWDPSCTLGILCASEPC